MERLHDLQITPPTSPRTAKKGAIVMETRANEQSKERRREGPKGISDF